MNEGGDSIIQVYVKPFGYLKAYKNTIGYRIMPKLSSILFTVHFNYKIFIVPCNWPLTDKYFML